MENVNGKLANGSPVELTDVELTLVFENSKVEVVEQLEELNYCLSRVGAALVKGGVDIETLKLRLTRMTDAIEDWTAMVRNPYFD